MILVESIGVEKEIIKTRFLCDIVKCKGACCNFYGDYGAPVTSGEARIIEERYDRIAPYLPSRSKEIIKERGFVEGENGSYTTVCIDKKDCVFVYYEGDVARCAIEKAFFDGKIEFRKPVSCHLFPVRVNRTGGVILYYEIINECRDAVEKGRLEDVRLTDTVEEALERSFGKEWVDKLKLRIKLENL